MECSRGESPSGRKGQKACSHRSAKVSSQERVRIRRVIVVYQNHKSVSGCKFGDKCMFRHTEATGRDQLPPLKECIQLGCVSQDTEPPSKSIVRRDQIAPSHTPTAHGTP